MRSFNTLSLFSGISLATFVACFGACAGAGDDDDDDNGPSGTTDARPVELADAAEPIADAGLPAPADAAEPIADAGLPAPADAAALVTDADLPDAAPAADADLPAADAAPLTPDAAPPTPDAAPPDAGLICSISTADFGAKGALANTTFIDPGTASATDNFIAVVAPLEAGDPADVMQIELYAGFGVFSAGIAPGTYTIAGAELQYASCGLCVRVLSNSSAAGFEHSYLATGGTVTITQAGTAVGGQFAATLSNLTMGHVNIMSTTPFTSTPASACTTELDSASVTATMVALPP